MDPRASRDPGVYRAHSGDGEFVPRDLAVRGSGRHTRWPGGWPTRSGCPGTRALRLGPSRSLDRPTPSATLRPTDSPPLQHRTVPPCDLHQLDDPDSVPPRRPFWPILFLSPFPCPTTATPLLPNLPWTTCWVREVGKLALPGIGGGTGKIGPEPFVWVLATGEYPNEYPNEGPNEDPGVRPPS
jgi:hypothetical protein